MADVDNEDDLETDEHGIYREKTEDYSGSENGLMVDEDGIWQDDVDSYYHGGNDSGFCTAEQKSYSSLNRVQEGADREKTIPGSHEVKYRLDDDDQTAEGVEEDEEEEELRTHHQLVEEHSCNISELEASRSVSVQDSQVSYHPEAEDVNSDSRYPELAKGYFTSQSELSRQSEKDTGHHGDSEYMAHYRAEDPYSTTNDEEYLSEREQLSERNYRSSSESMKSYTRRHTASAASDKKLSNSQTNRGENHSRIPTLGNGRITKNKQQKEPFLTSSHNTETDSSKPNGIELQHRRSERLDKSKISSQLTRLEQDETSMSQETEHSLVEFEQLEATLDEVSSSCSEDLIGLYLQETEQWGINTATAPQSESKRHSFSQQNNGDIQDKKVNSKVQDIPKRKRSTESHGSSRTNGSRSERTSRRAIHDAQKLPDSRNSMRQSSEKNELSHSQDTRNLLQQTSVVLTQLNQGRKNNGYDDSQSAALQGSQIPILRSRSSSLSRPGRHWSRSRHMSPSPSQSQSSLSSPLPPRQESEKYSSKNIPDSMVTDKRSSSNRQSSRTTGVTEHSPAQVGRIDSRRSHGNNSLASSIHAPSTSSRNQAPTSSAELSHSAFMLEQKVPVSRVESQMNRNTDESKTQRSSQNPTQSSSMDRSKNSSALVNQTGASSSTSWSNLNHHQSLRLGQSRTEPHVKKKRSYSLGGQTRQAQPLKAVPGFMKSSVPDAIGATSRRMAGTDGRREDEFGAVDFREMYQVENQQHRLIAETYKELEVGYLHLLKENAEIKNAMDSMRLGAEVKLIPAAPQPASLQTGTIPPAKHANIFTLSKMSTPSLSLIQREARVAEAGTVTTPQQATLSEVPQDGGIHTVLSVQPPGFQRSMEGRSPSLATKTSADAAAESSISLAEDVLSLSGRIKAAENRIKEFESCWETESIDEKIQFLQRIRDTYVELEDEFDNDFVQEEGIYSSAGRTRRNETESKLVRLHLTIGQLEDDVQAAIKSSDASRIGVEGHFVPNRTLFPVNDNGWNAAYSDSETHSLRHGGSVVSIAGNCDAEDELQDFNKTYTELMDQYRRLKQMKSSLQRDDDITETLMKLKLVYRQIPEHRKPALPAELENQYNPVKGSFIDTNSEQEEKKQNGLNAYSSLQGFSTSAGASTVTNDSDRSSGSKPDSVKHYLTSERQSSASQSSNASGSSQISLQQSGKPAMSHAKDTVSSRGRDNSLPSDRPRHGTRRLPRTASKSQSQAASQQDESGNGYHKLSGSKRSTHHRPPLPSNLQINAKPKSSSLHTKTEQKMIRTSAHTPPGQSYSDTESDGTDDTVEEIFKQKQKLGRGQLDSTDGVTQSRTKEEHRRAASVGSVSGEVDNGSLSATEDEIGLAATKRSDKREEGAESAHLQKFTEVQQRQMPQPIPLHPTTAINPSVTFYVPSLQRLQNPYLQNIQQSGLQQLQLQQPDIHQVYIPTGTFSAGTLSNGIIPAHAVTGNQGAIHGNYFARNGYVHQPHEPKHFLENGYGQSTSMVQPEAAYNAYHPDYLNTNRTHHQITRDGQRNGRENRHRPHPADRYQKSPHRSRTTRKRNGSKLLDDPLPSVYFEPTAHDVYPYLIADSNGLLSQRPELLTREGRPTGEAGAFLTQYADPYSFASTGNLYSNGVGTGVGSGLPTIYESLGISSRGIQNVPSMSTTGVQYMIENGLNAPYTTNVQHGSANPTGQVGTIGQPTADQPIVVTGASCPVCGRVDYHTHTDTSLQAHNGLGYIPASSSTQAGVVPVLPQRGQTLVRLPNGQIGLAFVGGSSNAVGLPYTAGTTFPSNLAGSLQANPVPNQIPPTNVTSSPSRIRYYVREYDNTENAEGSGIRHEKQRNHKNRSSTHHLSTDDDDDEVDWALLKLVSTAKSLKKRSDDMTTSLRNELLLTYRDSAVLQSF